ncbi:MAG: GTPase Era [Candidatus Latescibacteria bacterium]|nr:GTPase Era [Candidatus Latescibacterota bacterium]
MGDEAIRNPKSGYVAIIGKPNVGKSTLMNALVGERLSIVTPKPQTTRGRVLGIMSSEECQAVFWDTPGMLEPKGRLQEVMTRQIRDSVKDADVLLALVDASSPKDGLDERMREILHDWQRPLIVAINKSDLVETARVEKIKDRIKVAMKREGGSESSLPPSPSLPLSPSGAGPGWVVLAISALRGTHVDALKTLIEQRLPEGSFFYPPDMVAEQPERFFVSELVREEIFLKLGQELPYAAAVNVEEFKERKDEKDYIRAVIYVERSSQKGIVIGAKGAMLKQIGQHARVKIEAFLDRPVYLELWVKVRPKWRKRERDLKEFGYW